MSPDLSGPLDTVSDDPDANLSSLSEVLSQWSTHSLAQFLADHIEYLDNGEETIQLDASQISKLEVAMLILYGRHLKLQAVVGRLPPEILAIIFSFVCGTNNVYPDIMPYIIRLSLVCQRWRNVVFSTPSLWSSLSFDFEEWRLDLERLERIVLMFLAQSKLSPLSLDLDVVCDKVISPGKKASKACLQILATIVQHSHRWQTVELRISPDGLKHPVFHPIIGRLPNLRVLRLTGVEAHDMIGRNPKIFENSTLFLGCPFLEHAAMDRLMIEDSIALPWRQIRTLELNAIRHEEMFRSTLASCTNIEDLRLDDLDFQLIDFTTLRLPRLKHLAISSRYISTDLAPIFHCLDLPGLVSMDIVGGYWDGQLYGLEDTYIESFLARSSCNITSLSLINFPISDQDTLSLLRMTPRLKQLRIEEQRGWDTCGIQDQRVITLLFWNALSIGVASSHIVPQLTELSLKFHGDDLDEDALLNALASRSNIQPYLSIVTLRMMGVSPLKRDCLIDAESIFTLTFGRRTSLTITYCT